MNNQWLAVLFISIGAIGNAADRIFLKGVLDKIPTALGGFLRHSATFLFLVLMSILLESSLDKMLGFGEMPMNRAYWNGVIGTTFFNLIIQGLSLWSIKYGAVSLVVPISNITPLLITAAAIFKNEYPGALGWNGVVLTSVGTWITAASIVPEIKRWQDYFLPLRRALFPKSEMIPVDEGEKKKFLNSVFALRLALLQAVVSTPGLLFDADVSRNGSIGLGFGIENFAVALFFGGIALSWVSKKFEAPTPKIPIGRVLAGGFCFALTFFFTGYGFRYTITGEAGTLKRLQIPLVVLMSRFLKEEKFWQRLTGASITTAGLILIGLDTPQSKS